MDYQNVIKKCEESSYLISMVSIDDLIKFGYSLELNEKTNVLDLCCGYGEVLKIWSEAFGVQGTGVDISHEFIEIGQKRLKDSENDKITLVEDDALTYSDLVKYDVVILSETFDSVEKTLSLGEKFLKASGILVYQKVYSKIQNPPKELLDFEGEVLPLQELNHKFRSLGYYITHMASDSNAEWERYITWSARRDMTTLRNNPQDLKNKEWIDKWYQMYFDYRRKYQGQALFGLEKL